MTKPFPALRLATSMFSAPVITLVLSGLLITAPASAQVTSANVGLKGGLNLSNFHGAAIGDSETRHAKTFGLFVQLHFGGALSLQPEVNYSERGAEEADLLAAVADGVWSYNYLDFVPLLKLRVNSRRSSPALSLFTGPVVSFLIDAKATGLGPEGLHSVCAGCARELMSLPFSALLQHNTKGSDVGGTIGVDLAFGTGSSQLLLDLRYTRMMSEFDEAPYDEVYSRKHSALSLRARGPEAGRVVHWMSHLRARSSS